MAGEDEVAAVTQSPVPAQENGSSQAQQQQQHLDETLSVKVALHIRPLIGPERVQGCKDCIYVIPGEPQVQIGSHNFTFDHIYGSSGIPAAKIFDDCVSPLVEGLFHGYNATVLAYGQMIRLVATVSPEVTKHQAELKQSSLITLAKLFKPETGSGKTYTMGTAYVVGGSTHGVIPQVMETIFNNVKTMGDKYDFQLRVAFIEILKEEVHDLLDLTPLTASKQEGSSGSGGTKTSVPAKPPIQIRETPTGEITLVGVTETTVSSLEEMASCLEQGSLCRATGSTNMNSHSSRSHAIFTISLEKRRKANVYSEKVPAPDDGDDFLCAKLHLVDLAGSERAKRTGADGIRFKEGVHINKGLLALGNVISALGDDKRRKEGGHVPYRDSKLTRLLQDSLGGNSRTVMIACVSPADSNAEETLNTLKYANRARNIQNKPIVNRDPMVAEMQRLRQQVELLQAELMCVRAGSCPFDDMQIVLKEKMAWLESKNTELRRELQESRDNSQLLTRKVVEAELEKDKLLLRLQMLHNGGSHDDLDETQSMDVLEKYARKIHDLESEVQKMRNMSSGSLVHSSPALSLSLSPHYTELPESGGISDANVEDEDNDDAEDIDEEEMEEEEEEEEEGKDEDEEGEETAAKELEHTIWQDNMDQELQELNRRLELKEAEMKKYVTKVNGATIKHHFEKKISELEEEKKSLQKEKDTLQSEIEKLASQSDDNTQKVQETYKQKLKDLESQISELKKKQENQAQLLKQKQRSDEAVKQLNDEILRIKTQKVQLQNKMKQESEQFRQWKASREKEVLQLRKEGRKNEYQMHKLQALHQRQKMVLQRKTEEAAQATRRLKELLEARKPSFREKEGSGTAAANGSAGQAVNEKSLQKWLEHELEVAVHIHEVRNNYEKQKETRAALAKELAKLKQEEELHQAYLQESMKGNETASSAMKAPATSMSSDARLAKIRYIEGVLNASSSTLVAMASQLSEAEERERGFNGRARWQHLRTMGDAKSLLQTAFNSATFARCELWSKERENKELKGKIMKLTELMQKNEARRKEERQQAVGGQDVAKPLPSIKEANNGEIDERTHGVVDNTSVARLSRGSQPPQQIESGSTASFATTPPFDKHKSYNAYHGEVDSSTEGESDMDLVDDGNQSNNEWSEEDSEQAEEGKGGGSSGRNRPRGANNAARSKSKGASSASAGWEFPSMQEDDRTDRAGGPSQAGSGAHEEGRRRNRRATEEEQRASSQSSSTTTAAAAANCQNSTPSSASSPLLPTRGAEEEGTTGDHVQESACQRSSSPQPTQQEVMREVEMAEALDRLGEPDIDEATRSHAVEVLRHHGAAILREALREGEGFRSASPPRDNAIGRRRRPLADIGNGNAQAARNRQRGRELRKPWRKTVVVQIVSIPPVQPEGETRPPPPPPIHGFLSNPESERLTVPATPLAENWHEDRDASPNTNAAQMLLQGRRKKGGGTGSPNSPRLSPARARTINNNNNSNNNNNTRTGALLSSSSSSSSSSSFSSSSLSSRSEKKQHPSSSSHSSPSSPSASPSFSGSDKENV